MKQIILEQKAFPVVALSPGRLLLVWGFYGYAMALLSRLAGSSWPHQAALWAIGALAGLLLAAREI